MADLELLGAVRDFALRHSHPDIARFADAIRDWGDEWLAIDAEYLPAAEFLTPARKKASGANRELLETLERHRHDLRWEQSYRRQDGLVPDAMLDGYAFAEIIGTHGPFLSERVRAGIGIWGSAIEYPRHHHAAEEIYAIVCGTARFSIGDSTPVTRRTGDVVYVACEIPHGFCTTQDILVVYCLWQAGDLRQTSNFG